MRPYEEIEGFEEVYLEDSFVLAVRAEPGALTIDLDVVLREGHPRYEAPGPDEQNCYRRGRIRFEEVSSLTWAMPTVRPATDATGEEDWGGVDRFEHDGGRYELEGDVGHLDISAGRCTIELQA